MQNLDLYINVSQSVILSVQGASELHLSGYFEPQNNEMDEGMMFDDEEEELDEEEEIGTNGKLS